MQLNLQKVNTLLIWPIIFHQATFADLQHLLCWQADDSHSRFNPCLRLYEEGAANIRCPPMTAFVLSSTAPFGLADPSQLEGHITTMIL